MYNPFNLPNVERVERNKAGDWFTQISMNAHKGRFKSDAQRLNTVLLSPAFLKIAKLLCDTFSLGRIYVSSNNKIIDNDPILDKLQFPNFYQSQRQFLWDYMFWLLLGTSYLYTNKKILSDDTQLYFLIPERFVWTDELIKKIDRIALSKETYREIEGLKVEYINLDGSSTWYDLEDIKPLFDLSNGVGHWYKGNSSVDALYKVIGNSELSLDAKGTNLDFSRKFLVNGTVKADDTYNLPMGEDEATHAKNAILGTENIQVIKSSVDIKRYVDNLGSLKLDEQYWSDYFMIGTMYNIPRELLETYNAKGATFENQEKGLARLIELGIQAKGSDLMDVIGRHFGYNEQKKKLIISWDHLSFMQVFKKQKNENIEKELEIINKLFEMGAITEEEKINRAKYVTNGN